MFNLDRSIDNMSDFISEKVDNPNRDNYDWFFNMVKRYFREYDGSKMEMKMYYDIGVDGIKLHGDFSMPFESNKDAVPLYGDIGPKILFDFDLFNYLANIRVIKRAPVRAPMQS